MNPIPPDPENSRSDDLPVPVSRVQAQRPVTVNPAALSAAIDAPTLIYAFSRRWPLALMGGLTIGALATVAAFFVVPPPKYTVRAMIHIASNPARIIFQTSESIPDYHSYQKTQATLAKSRKVLTAALRMPEVVGLRSIPTEGDAANWLDRELKVDFPGGAEIMTVNITGSDAKEATTLVNAVCDAYLKQIVEEERRDRVTRYDSLQTLYNKLQDELREKRKTYRVSVEDVGVTDKLSVATRQQMATQHLGQLQIELTQLQTEIRQMQRKSKLAAARKESTPVAEETSSDTTADQALAQDPEIASLKKIREQLSLKLSDANRVSRNPGDPSVTRAKDRLESNDRAIRQRIETVRNLAVQASRRDLVAQDDQTRSESEQTLAILTEQEKTLREQVSALGSEIKSGNVKTVDMNWLDDEIDLASRVAKTVGSEVEALKVELSAQPRIRLIERAETPVLSDPLRRFKVSGAIGLGFFAMFAGAVVLLEARNRRVGSTEEVAHKIGIRLIGSIPARPNARQIRKNNESWQQMLIESVDSARTLILHASRQDPLKIIMIASAVKGEGKTTLACLLAASLNRAGRRTLLIDADLRCPTIHRLFDIASSAGLSEVLRGDAELDQVIVPGAGPGVDFLPAGKIDSDSLQGLANGRIGLVLELLRDRYDQIIVDSAPALYVTDTSMLAQHVDAVVMSVLRDVSQVPKVYAAYQLLDDLGVRILGAVMSGTKAEDSRGYAYQYSRGTEGGKLASF
jgi:succinoglycan biosynthesis transport protein ExoP